MSILGSDGSIQTGDLRIENGHLTDTSIPCDLQFDGSSYCVTPGLVNSHTHVAMGFFRGLTYNAKDMIETIFYPAERALKEEWMRSLSYSYLYAGLRSGVTCFIDHYYFSKPIAEAIHSLGVRGVVGETIADINSVLDGPTSWKRARKDIENWELSTVKPCIAPHATDTLSRSLLSELGQYANEHNLPIHLHLDQTQGEKDRVQNRESMSPISYADSCKVLTDKTLAVHLVATQDSNDLKILKERGTTIGFCPSSQLLYAELSPFHLFHEHSIPLALGTDCAACNDGGDLLAEMRLTSLLFRDRKIPHTTADILDMVTHNPIQVFDVPYCTMQAGSVADLVFLKKDLDVLPTTSAGENLLYSFQSRHVQHVMVEGQWVLWDEKPTLMSLEDMRTQYLESVERVKKAANLN